METLSLVFYQANTWSHLRLPIVFMISPVTTSLAYSMLDLRRPKGIMFKFGVNFKNK
jgi:hypothetical protein